MCTFVYTAVFLHCYIYLDIVGRLEIIFVTVVFMLSFDIVPDFQISDVWSVQGLPVGLDNLV